MDNKTLKKDFVTYLTHHLSKIDLEDFCEEHELSFDQIEMLEGLPVHVVDSTIQHKMTSDALIVLAEAIKSGKQIQARALGSETWLDITGSLDILYLNQNEYRVKPGA